MKTIQWIISALVAVVIIAAAVGGGVYFTRLKSIHSIRKLTDYENYNLYRMDIDYAYDLDRLIDRGITDNQSMINAILAEALPYLPIHMKAPNFGCSAFCTQGTDGHTLMGRNYDFKNDTSAMLVYCTPKDGYASVAFAALDNINANTPDASMAKKLATLTAPFICLDGMNEKGVSIAVLTLDSDPTYQQTGKPMIATTLAIRLVLDRAATTAEAVELLSKYDMFASSGWDYHFYITDASGDGRVLEFNQQSTAYMASSTQLGATFISDILVSQLPAFENLVYYKLDGEEAKRKVFFYYKTHKYKTRVMEEFIRMMHEQI